MKKRRPREVRSDERQLWEAYASGVRSNLPQRGPTDPEIRQAQPMPPVRPTPQPLPAFRIGQNAKPGPESVAIAAPPAPWDGAARLDRKALGKLKKGRTGPDGRIDLHGMTVDEAHGALITFVLSCQARGDRLLLVITGKGRDQAPAPAERGILRRQVPHWLALPPLNGAVLDVTPAHRRHGGDGAFYVYLRRLR
ncbi:MAG: Smr/MutS family protein [Paracoccaceae bacterium]|nr:Smr/MutS family protein [Paracoccaceae bacterium]